MRVLFFKNYTYTAVKDSLEIFIESPPVETVTVPVSALYEILMPREPVPTAPSVVRSTLGVVKLYRVRFL